MNPPPAAAPAAVKVVEEDDAVVPTPDDVAQREQLRDLGKELARLDMERKRDGGNWYNSVRLTLLIQTEDAELHGVLTPYVNAALIEAHVEQVLDLVIRLAPQELWIEWLRESLRIVAFCDRADMFPRLFAAQGNSFQGWNSRQIDQLLISASTQGSTEVVSALLAIDGVVSLVREVDEVYRPLTSLYFAAHAGHRSIVATLIDAGAPLEYKHMLGGTALTAAVEKGHDGVVLELLAAGADVNNINDKDVATATCMCTINCPDYTPLCIATAMNYTGIVDILLAAGAHLGDELSETLPLHVAAEWGCLGPLDSLLRAGAEVNLIDSRGRSALHMACVQSDPGRVGRCNSDGRCPNHSASLYSQPGTSVERLLQAGADVHHPDSKGRSALHIACWHSHERAVEMLLRRGARPNMLCHEGRLPSDLIGLEALKIREGGTWTRTFRWPRTLNLEETSVADRISTMLRGASAWGRRGWLVMMRARHHDKKQAARVTPGSPLSHPVQAQRAAKQFEVRHHGNGDKPDAGEAGYVLPALRGMRITGASPSDVTPSLSALEDEKSGRTEELGAEGDKHGGEATVGWKGAVAWLVRCPDERGTFREVVGFI